MTHGRVINILCTLGPSSLNRATIERLEARGVDLFRINLSHTPLEKIAPTIEIIRSFSSVPVCLDTEGAQVRTGPMGPDIVVADRQRVILTDEPVLGSASRLALTPASAVAALRPGALVGLDFDGVVLLVVRTGPLGVETLVLNGGKVGSNKAVVVDPAPDLPALSEKDIRAAAIGREAGIRHFALSFANSADDVRLLRNLVGPDSVIISKIESRRGVRNIDGILAESDEILIDRGDLSREVPLENLPFLQKAIIRKANFAKVPVNVATNLLESMIVNRKPTRAELNDIVNTMLDGANGLVLAAETAVGDHPVGAVDMVLGLIERYRRSLDGHRIEDLLQDTPVLAPPALARHRFPAAGTHPAARASRFPAIEVDIETATDIEHLAQGAFSPLSGFMIRDELESVLDHNRLPDGQAWTMPIILQGRSQEFASFQPGQSVRLIDPRTGESTAVLHIEDKFEVELDNIARRWFGTTDRAHPGVARFVRRGVTVLGGPVEPLAPASVERQPCEFSPRQTRAVFDIKGWTKIVAFHSRSVPHRAHERTLIQACERSNADGIFLQPVIGPSRPGDFSPAAIVAAYERLVEADLPNALLGAINLYPRYCGARDDVFAALCRRNFGCTHFVLGHSRARVSRGLFKALGDIGITPVFIDDDHRPAAAETGAARPAISGATVRSFLASNTPIPEWCMRPDISLLLSAMAEGGRPVLVS